VRAPSAQKKRAENPSILQPLFAASGCINRLSWTCSLLTVGESGGLRAPLQTRVVNGFYVADLWPDELTFMQAIEPFLPRLAGHQQATDAYLLALAIHHKAKLATLDRSAPSLLPEKSRAPNSIEIV
jgi:hypothetical protein